MTDHQFAEGQRVYHTVLGCYGRWLNEEPNNYSRVEIENADGRNLLCPTRTLQSAGDNE